MIQEMLYTLINTLYLNMFYTLFLFVSHVQKVVAI